MRASLAVPGATEERSISKAALSIITIVIGGTMTSTLVAVPVLPTLYDASSARAIITGTCEPLVESFV